MWQYRNLPVKKITRERGCKISVKTKKQAKRQTTCRFSSMLPLHMYFPLLSLEREKEIDAISDGLFIIRVGCENM
jgi:hypothetical protein